MQFKKYTKQRNGSIQGLRSFKDTLPKNIKKFISKRGQIYSETLNNWKHIVGENLFKVCYPKSYKNSNKFGVSTLTVMVRRGNEVDLEYSKKEIITRMNTFFEDQVVEKIKLTSFNDERKIIVEKNDLNLNVTNNKFKDKISNVKNEKIKKSLLELTNVFKEKARPRCATASSRKAEPVRTHLQERDKLLGSNAPFRAAQSARGETQARPAQDSLYWYIV